MPPQKHEREDPSDPTQKFLIFHLIYIFCSRHLCDQMNGHTKDPIMPTNEYGINTISFKFLAFE